MIGPPGRGPSEMLWGRVDSDHYEHLGAEAKIGEMLNELPRAQGNRYTGKVESCTAAASKETKESAVERLGFEKT